MDHMAKYYKNLSEHLFNQRDHLLRLLNEVAQAPKKSQSRLVDGVWVDDDGNPVPGAPGAPGAPIPLSTPDLLTPTVEPIAPADMVGPPTPPPNYVELPPPNEVPALLGINEPGSPGVAPLPQNPNPTFTPQNPGLSPASQLPSSGTPAPSDREKEQRDFENARRGYYAKRNQQIRDEAEERITAIDALAPSKNERTNARRAVNRLKAQRAMKKGNDKFKEADIERMTKSDSTQRFMSQADKDAQKAKSAAVVRGMEKEGHEKLGHTQNERGEWVDAQGEPAPYAVGKPIDRFGPDKIIQGTSMTYGEFERQTGRKYNALNKEDSTLVSRLAGAGKYGSEAARQGALSSDAMNQGYQKQNDEMAKETGRLDRQVDASQRELDRFRNDPKYRESQRNLDSKGNPIRTPELEAQIAAETERDVQGIKNVNSQKQAARQRSKEETLASEMLIRRMYDDEAATYSMNDRVNRAADTNSDLRAQERFDSSPAELAKLRALQNRQDKKIDFDNEPGLSTTVAGPPKPGFQTQSDALQNEIEQNNASKESDTKRKQAELDDEMRGLGLIPDTEEAPRPEFNQPTTGGQVTQAAANMTTAPAEEMGPPKPEPSVSTGGMNQPMDINDFPEEEKPQTTLPSVSGGQVTNAAANMTTQPAKPTPAGANSAVGQPQLQTRQQAPPPASAPTSVGPPSSAGTRNTTPATQPTTSPVSGNPNPVTPTVAPARNATIPQPTATPARPPAPAAPPVAVGSSVTAKAATMTTKPQLASAGAPIDPQQTGGPTAQNRGIPIPSANPMADAQAGPLGAPLKKKLVASAGRTPNIRA